MSRFVSQRRSELSASQGRGRRQDDVLSHLIDEVPSGQCGQLPANQRDQTAGIVIHRETQQTEEGALRIKVKRTVLAEDVGEEVTALQIVVDSQQKVALIVVRPVHDSEHVAGITNARQNGRQRNHGAQRHCR